MPYSATVRGERFIFPELRDLLAKANEEKSGDQRVRQQVPGDHARRAISARPRTDR